MANDLDMLKDIAKLEQKKKTRQQGIDLSALYYWRYVRYNAKTLERLKQNYIRNYGDLDNYV